jgi:hypothetical protein
MEKKKLGITITTSKPSERILKMYRGDLFICPICQKGIIGDFGKMHVRESSKMPDKVLYETMFIDEEVI